MDFRDILKPIIENYASQMGLDPILCMAIAGQETDYHPFKVRFEPRWIRFVIPNTFSEKLGISILTEQTLQAISWGPMQVMGAVCRELGYQDHLTKLTDPYIGALYGCKKLRLLCKQYSDQNDIISSYNAGSVKKDGQGNYCNQQYVNNVLDRIKDLR